MRLLLCLLFASTAFAGDVKIENVRLSQSLYGPILQGNQFVPGDRIVARFDALGVKEDKGVNRFTLSFDFLDAKGTSAAHGSGGASEGRDVFGRGSLACLVDIDLGPMIALGKYTVKVHLEDHIANSAADKDIEVEVIDGGFRAVGARLAFDDDGKQEHGREVSDGEGLYFVYRLVGVAEKEGKSHVQVDFVVLDEGGKVVTNIPDEIDSDVQAADGFVLVRLAVKLNGKGKFTLKAISRDTVGKKETRVLYPLEIHAAR